MSVFDSHLSEMRRTEKLPFGYLWPSFRPEEKAI